MRSPADAVCIGVPTNISLDMVSTKAVIPAAGIEVLNRRRISGRWEANEGPGNEKAPASRARWRDVRSAKVPRSLPLELSVLPDSGGQAFAGDPDNLSHWNSPSYRSKSRTN